MKKLKNLLIIMACLSFTSCGSSTITGREEYKNYGEQVDDTRLVSSIRTNFRKNPLIPHHLIHIAVDRGVVQLSGFVKTHREADLAIVSARSIPGTKDVINSMIVLSSSEYGTRRGVVEQYSHPR